MELEELIGKFAANAGIENVQAVEGVWKFSADGNVFGVMDDDTGGRVWLFGDIAATDVSRKDALVKAAMEANYFYRGTGGATFSLNPDTGNLTLFDSRPLDGLDEKGFYSFVEKFVNALATWNAIAEAAGALPESSNDTPPSDMSQDKFATSGFLAV